MMMLPLEPGLAVSGLLLRCSHEAGDIDVLCSRFSGAAPFLFSAQLRVLSICEKLCGS